MKLNAKPRKKQNITQKQLGDMLGLSAAAIGMYEQGRRRLPADVLFDSAKLLGVSPETMASDE